MRSSRTVVPCPHRHHHHFRIVTATDRANHYYRRCCYCSRCCCDSTTKDDASNCRRTHRSRCSFRRRCNNLPRNFGTGCCYCCTMPVVTMIIFLARRSNGTVRHRTRRQKLSAGRRFSSRRAGIRCTNFPIRRTTATNPMRTTIPTRRSRTKRSTTASTSLIISKRSVTDHYYSFHRYRRSSNRSSISLIRTATTRTTKPIRGTNSALRRRRKSPKG